MERSYNDQLTPGKKLGAMVFGEPKVGLTYAGSAFQMNDSERDYKSEDMSYAGRGTINFAELMGDKESIYHFGVAGFDKSFAVRGTTSSGTSGGREPSGTFLAFSSPGRGLSNVFRAQMGGEAAGANLQSALSDETFQAKSRALGLEAIIARGPFKIQGEYGRGNHKANYQLATGETAMDIDTNTWYTEALWLVTGEKYSDSYKKGVFGGIKPKNNFDADGGSGWGALELGFRMEAYDAKDGSITNSQAANADGRGARYQGSLNCATGDAIANNGSAQADVTGCKSGAKTYTAGLKWILNPNVLVKLNYMHTRFDNEWQHYDVNPTSATAANAQTPFIKKEDLLMFRTQYTF
jgi:phosphate-selective porin OprO/OprP